ATGISKNVTRVSHGQIYNDPAMTGYNINNQKFYFKMKADETDEPVQRTDEPVIELWHERPGEDDVNMERAIEIGRHIRPGDIIVFDWKNDGTFDHVAIFLSDSEEKGIRNYLDPYDNIIHTNGMKTYIDDFNNQGVLGFEQNWPLHCLFYTFNKENNKMIETNKNQRFVIKRFREINGGKK
ncbi:MAG: hypothetical protein WC337_10650, partial [Candidatus Muiribacteriota bacterium]